MIYEQKSVATAAAMDRLSPSLPIPRNLPPVVSRATWYVARLAGLACTKANARLMDVADGRYPHLPDEPGVGPGAKAEDRK